jgi:predicted ATP-dependent Lon-type protease
LVRTASGGFSVSVFRDKAGTDESVRVAREWIAKNAANVGAGAPAISEGDVILHVK